MEYNLVFSLSTFLIRTRVYMLQKPAPALARALLSSILPLILRYGSGMEALFCAESKA